MRRLVIALLVPVVLLLAGGWMTLIAIVLVALIGSTTVVAGVLAGTGAYLLIVALGVLVVFWLPDDVAHARSGPPVSLLAVAFVAAVLLGSAGWQDERADLGAMLVLLGAGLPPLIALTVALQRLGTGVRRRLLAVGLLIGTFLSTSLAIALEWTVPALLATVVLPLRDVLSDLLRSESLEGLFYERSFVVVMIQYALTAPLVEELVKPLAVVLLLRWIPGRREALLVGMAGGAGFAALENLFYEGMWEGADWSAVTASRAIGAALHPLGSGLVGLAIYDAWRGAAGAWARVGGAYALAVALHMAWNGGLVMLYSALGARLAVGDSAIDLFGEPVLAIVAAWIVLLGILCWWLLVAVVAGVREEASPAEARPVAALALDRTRVVAALATVAFAGAIATGELWGPVLARQLTVAFG